jgi:aminoglycoside phosphotransferase (APT) family kinase protein
VVALGVDRADPERPRWVLKSGVGERHAAAFDRTLASATLLDRLAGEGKAAWLVPPGADRWRVGKVVDRALLAMPWQDGVPVATEGLLNGDAATRLMSEGVPRLAGVLVGLDALTPTVPGPPDSQPELPSDADYRLRMTRRMAERLGVLVDTDGLDPAQAKAVEVGFGALVDDAPLAHAFCHGELTPYHVIVTRDGRVALIDLESMEPNGIRHVDLTVCAMRIWVLNEQPATAQALIDARLRDLSTDAKRTFDAETRWQWVYAAVRTRQESMAWDARHTVTSFWDWAMGPILGRR